MKLSSDREVIQIQRDGYTEALIAGDESSEMTESEWQEYGSRVLEESRKKLAQARKDRIARNRASFALNPCRCFPDGTLSIDCPVHQSGIRAAIEGMGL